MRALVAAPCRPRASWTVISRASATPDTVLEDIYDIV
jgi:hypothetical protein